MKKLIPLLFLAVATSCVHKHDPQLSVGTAGLFCGHADDNAEVVLEIVSDQLAVFSIANGLLDVELTGLDPYFSGSLMGVNVDLQLVSLDVDGNLLARVAYDDSDEIHTLFLTRCVPPPPPVVEEEEEEHRCFIFKWKKFGWKRWKHK